MIPRAPYCHQEVVTRDGFLDACNAPACTSRIDDDGDEFPVCVDHQEPR